MACRLVQCSGLLLLVGLLVLPTVAATDFEGAGQTGTVPVGEGGETVALLGGTVADDRLFVALGPIPADACRLVLDGNGTYAPTGVSWAPGETTAYVWAEAGARQVPFRLHAVWQTDLNGNCTVEKTESKTYWHDPRGRPYTELTIEGHRQIQRGHAGSEIPMAFHVANNGTIEAVVTARITVISDEFRATSDGAVVDVPVPAGERVPFAFKVDVPIEVEPANYVLQVTFSSDDGWSDGATGVIEVRPPPGGVPEPTSAPDLADASPLPPPTITAEESPALAPLVVMVVVLLVIAWRRHY